jgi:hypothetical protein
MWIARSLYDAVNESRVKAEAIQHAQEVQIATLQAHLEWLRVRLTQLEFERAGLLQKYMGVSVPVPSFEDSGSSPDPNQTMDFNDMGDEEAARQGVDWNADGTLSYRK